MKRLLPHIAMTLFGAQLLLMLGSWLYSAAQPMSGVRSLLSGEGLRWMFGHFADFLAKPQLVWLLLLSMGYGALRGSGIFQRQTVHEGYRLRRARWVAVCMLLLMVAVLLLFTILPHAVLLSATGSLWPSPFSRSLVPFAALTAVVVSASYGVVAGRFAHLSDVFSVMLDGLRQAAPLLLLYILVVQLYESLRFMFF
jgi:aminobenzoyl-glutamate transport protein